MRYALEEGELGRVGSRHDPPNAASLRVILKLGMKPLGEIAPNQPG